MYPHPPPPPPPKKKKKKITIQSNHRCYSSCGGILNTKHLIGLATPGHTCLRTCNTKTYLSHRTCNTKTYLSHRTCNTKTYLSHRTCNTKIYLSHRTCNSKTYLFSKVYPPWIAHLPGISGVSLQ